MESHIKIKDIIIDFSQCFDKKDVPAECEHFTIRGYASEMRKLDSRRCNPFPANESGELPPLPPLEVPNFRRFGCDNCRDKAAATGIDKIFVRDSGTRQQEHVASGIEIGEPSLPMSNPEERGLDLNQVVDLNDSECMPSSDERENNNEVITIIADHEVSLGDCLTGITEEANIQSKKERRKFSRVSRKTPNIAEEDDSTDDDGKPKKTRLLSEVMRREMVVPGGMLSKRKAGRGRKRKSLVELENHNLVEAQHHVSTETEMDRVVEDSFSPSSHQYENSLPYLGPFQEGTSRSQNNIREENEPALFQDLNILPIDINENIEAENIDMNVDMTTEESANRPVLSIDNEAMEVAEILANNLQAGSPQENSLHEQRKTRDFDLNCPIVNDLDEELDSNNNIVCPPIFFGASSSNEHAENYIGNINVSDGNSTIPGRRGEMISIGETSDPMRIVPENYCRHNRNPADFTAPEEGNPYMMNGEDILIFERYNPRKIPAVLASIPRECKKKKNSYFRHSSRQ